MTLEEAVRAGDVERALFEVGSLVMGPDGLDALPRPWIAILAAVAEHVGEDTIRAFADIQRGIAALIDELEAGADGIKARNLFVVTTKLVLLWKRCRGAGKRCPNADRHIAHLREKVMVHFPEGANLSEKGMERFASILREAGEAGEAERALVVRILAGLCKLYSTGDTQNLRTGLEYMSRRRLAVFADETDLLGILWDILCILDQGSGFVATSHRLFQYRQKKKDRALRRPLLWVCGYAPALVVATTAGASIWGYEEEELLRLVATKTPELWKQVREIYKDTAGRSDAEEARREEQMRLLMTYMPRQKDGEAPSQHRPMDGGVTPSSRTFHVSDRGRGADLCPSRDIRGVVHVQKREQRYDKK